MIFHWLEYGILLMITTGLAYANVSGDNSTYVLVENDLTTFVVKNSKGVPCLLVGLNTSICIGCSPEKILKENIPEIYLPTNAEVSGHCGKKKSFIKFKWKKDVFKLNITFEILQQTDYDANKTEKPQKLQWGATQVGFSYNVTNNTKGVSLKVGRNSYLATNLSLFSASLGKCYMCFADTQLNIAKPKTDEAYITFFNVKIQPFNISSVQYGDAEVCEADKQIKALQKETTIVPIIVAACLAVIVVVVIVGYVISRKTGMGQKEYKSME